MNVDFCILTAVARVYEVNRRLLKLLHSGYRGISICGIQVAVSVQLISIWFTQLSELLEMLAIVITLGFSHCALCRNFAAL